MFGHETKDDEVVSLRLPTDTLALAKAHAGRLHISVEMFVVYALIRYMDDRGYMEVAKALGEANPDESPAVGDEP